MLDLPAPFLESSLSQLVPIIALTPGLKSTGFDLLPNDKKFFPSKDLNVINFIEYYNTTQTEFDNRYYANHLNLEYKESSVW